MLSSLNVWRKVDQPVASMQKKVVRYKMWPNLAYLFSAASMSHTDKYLGITRIEDMDDVYVYENCMTDRQGPHCQPRDDRLSTKECNDPVLMSYLTYRNTRISIGRTLGLFPI